MDISNAQRAKVLVQALPYIQEYYGKVVVVKYGGNAMINDALKDKVIRDIVLLSLIGVKVVLVHGGGPEITNMLERVGKESKFVDGLRVTDKESVEIVQMVLAGKINKSLVHLLEQKGGRGVGLSGLDGHMIKAEMKDKELGYSTVGPHRDDIKIEIDSIDARKFASQGQQRTIALAMKLGEVEMYKQETGETPVLLLDDVLSELDKTRRDVLLKATSGVQTILTCTEFDGEGAKLFEVKEGKIR